MKQTRPNRFSLSLQILFILAPLVILLAVLQYRWLNRMRANEREQRLADLQASAHRFCDDFDHEISRAYVSFQVESNALCGQDWSDFAGRYARWMAQAPYPRLISEVWLVSAPVSLKPLAAAGRPINILRGDGNSSNAPVIIPPPVSMCLPRFSESTPLRVARFNQATARFETTEWPAGLESLRRRYDEATRRIGGLATIQNRNLLTPVDEETLSVIIPIVRSPLFNRPGGHRRFLTTAPELGFTIVVLNRDYIKQEFIPTLAGRYFSGGLADGSLDYDLSIVSRREPQNVFYSSGPGTERNLAASNDASANFMRVKFKVVEDGLTVADFDPPRISFRSVSPYGEDLARVARATEGAGQGEVFSLNDSSSLWRLLLKHRAGSLDEDVAQAHRRNLTISFAILLSLAASGVLILISIRRERRLARRQIEFVAGVSHELRAPVAAVCMTSANLADDVVLDRERVREYGHMIQAEGRRLAEMIEQTLSFAGADANRPEPPRNKVKVEALIENALAPLRPQMEKEGFVCEVEIPSAIPSVQVDAPAIESALRNLLGNAIKYSGDSRRIKLRANVARKKGAMEIQITVEDQGLGIEPDELREIFEPFRRGRAAVEENIPGSGLGLSLVSRIMEAHGGRVSVCSVPGQGSAFTIHLPAA